MSSGPNDFKDVEPPQVSQDRWSRSRDMLKQIVTYLTFGFFVAAVMTVPLWPIVVLYFFGFELAAIVGLAMLIGVHWFEFEPSSE